MASKSECLLDGDYDAEVEVDLLSWPSQGYISVKLRQDFATVERLVSTDGTNWYLTAMIDGLQSLASTNATSVRLRLTPVGDVVSGYFFAADTQSWQLLHSHADPRYLGPTFLTLHIAGGWTTPGAEVRWRNFNAIAEDVRCVDTNAPFTPSFTINASNSDASDPSIAPSDDTCTLGLPCKTSQLVQIPAGQPLFEGSFLPEVMPDVQAFEITRGTDVPVGAVVGEITVSIMSDLGTRAQCDTLLQATLPLVNATLPPSAGGGPSGTGASLDRLSPSVWPVQFDWNPQVKDAIAAGAEIWARYLAVWNDIGVPGTSLAINILVFKGPGSEWSMLSWADGVIFPASFWEWCTEFNSLAVFSGSTPSGQVLRRCMMEGVHDFGGTFEAAWSAANANLTDSLTCALAPLVDDDGDGIDNAVDGQMISAVFSDESTVLSDSFTDEHTGGSTSGEIVDRGDVIVTVPDEPNPRGVRVKAEGSGVPATIDACGSILTLETGQQTVITFGSTGLVVTNGSPVAVDVGTMTLTAPSGTFVVVDQLLPNRVFVENQLGSWSSVNVGGAEVPPGQAAIINDVDSDGVFDFIDNCPNWYNPSQTLPPWLVPACDADCDGFTSADEGSIGTDPNVHCGADAWPPDFDDNMVINTTDVFQVLPPALGQAVTTHLVRQNLFPGDAVINTTDVFRVLPPFLGSSCTP